MQSITTNWKTSLTGAAIIVAGGLHTFLGLDIPGAMDIGQALTVGLGLIFAQDSRAA